MGTNNVIFLEVIDGLMNREGDCPPNSETGSGEIQVGAQLIVRESQGQSFYNGRAYDCHWVRQAHPCHRKHPDT